MFLPILPWRAPEGTLCCARAASYLLSKRSSCSLPFIVKDFSWPSSSTSTLSWPFSTILAGGGIRGILRSCYQIRKHVCEYKCVLLQDLPQIHVQLLILWLKPTCWGQTFLTIWHWTRAQALAVRTVPVPLWMVPFYHPTHYYPWTRL